MHDMLLIPKHCNFGIHDSHKEADGIRYLAFDNIYIRDRGKLFSPSLEIHFCLCRYGKIN